MIAAVTVFCGSSDLVDAKYFDAARELGEKLARRRWRLVYGGGSVGLMPPYRADIQHLTGLPVFDIVSLVRMIHVAVQDGQPPRPA